MSAGLVIRNHLGQCLLAATEPLKGFTPPELAEALALRRAMVLAREHGFGKAIFASDCLSLIQRVNSKIQDRSLVGNVVADIKFLRADFSLVSFRHVHRSLNEAAHTLARTCDSSSSGALFDFAPDCIREILCIDLKAIQGQTQ